MPRRAAARGGAAAAAGRMGPIVLPSSHHLERILSTERSGREGAGVRKSSSQDILYGAWRKRQALSVPSTSEQRL